MMIRILSILLALTWLAHDGEKEGRTGNKRYMEEQYAAAVESYEQGLASLSENAPRMLRYGLLNNLGAALLKSGNIEAAGDAFTRALASAAEATDVARTSYNAGNSAYAAKELESALTHYRTSLLADPGNEEAKFNYEFVKRQLDRQQQNQQDQGGDRSEENDQKEEEQEQENGSEEQEQEQNQRRNQDEQEQGGGQDEPEPTEQEEEQREGQAEAAQSGTELSEEQAERILDALRNDEEQLLRQVQRPKSRPRQVDKDW